MEDHRGHRDAAVQAQKQGLIRSCGKVRPVQTGDGIAGKEGRRGMNVILLSGGSGKRLWPLSNDVRSKQFIRMFRRPDGLYESMVQRVYRQLKSVDPGCAVTIATAKSQVSSILNHLGENVRISLEPCRRDTFPAIALASAYLHDVEGIPGEEAVVVCPSDAYAQDDYFFALRRLWDLAREDATRLVLMGMEPSYPSEKYGYILPKTADPVAKVEAFREKPEKNTAQKYIEAGGLWNAGIFACKLRYVLERAQALTGFSDYERLLAHYEELPKISFDYAVAEHEADIAVLRFSGEWKDLGTWKTLTEAMEETATGDVRMDETCRNVHAVNELELPMLVMGLRDAVIAATPEGILVSGMERSMDIKPYVDALDRPVRFAEKSWGTYRVLDAREDSLTVRASVTPGQAMSCHSHDRRDEIWTVISGEGVVFVDGAEKEVFPGDVIRLPAGCRHRVRAGEQGLELIEIQLGQNISALDKHKYE